MSAFQANFEGTSVKEEADPQSLHTAEYTYAGPASPVRPVRFWPDHFLDIGRACACA